MRTFTAPELALMHGNYFQAHARFYIASPTAVLNDFSALNGLDHLIKFGWRGSADDLVESGTAVLWKKVGAQSIIPGDEASLLNRNGGGSYEAYIEPGRLVEIQVAITAPGVAPSTWYKMFQGRIDEVQWEDRGRIAIAFRDLGAILADADIADTLSYATASLEATIQEILDDALGAGVVTLFVPVATGKTVPAFQQEPGNLFEAIRKLARENGQFDVRYKWDAGTSAFRLTLFAPDLSTSSPDFTMGPSEYTEIQELFKNKDQVRNIIRVSYASGIVQLTDPTSVTNHGPRLHLISAPTIATPLDATANAAAALADMKDPLADHRIRTLFFPPVEIRDTVGWLANADVYTTQKNYGVVAWEHTYEKGRAHTSMRTSQKNKLAGATGWGASTSGDDVDYIVEQWLTGYNGENLVAQLPGWDPEKVYGQTEEVALPMLWFQRVLVGDNMTKLSGSLQISASNGADTWTPKLRFLDVNGAELPISRTGGAATGNPGVFGAVSIWDAVVPVGTKEIRYGIAPWGGGAPAGTATWRRPSLNRGKLDSPYNETESFRSASVSRAVAASLALQTQYAEPAIREGEQGIPGDPLSRRSTLGLRDRAGLLDTYDAETRHIMNLLAEATVTDSLARAINRFLGKPLSADPDTADSVQSGVLKDVVLQTALTSGQPDLSKAGVINRTLQYIADTAVRYAAPVPNATSDVTLIASAGMEVLGNNLRKSSGVSDWDEQVYSKESYTGGAYAQAKAQSALMMFGLNTDPTLNASYTSIDYAMYIAAANDLRAYESNVDRGSIGTWAVGDVLAVTYDGSNVRYLKNGAVLRTVAAAVNLVLFFDSSFYAGGEIRGLRFGPMSSNNAAAIGAGALLSSITNSEMEALTRMFATALAADPSNADSIPGGLLKDVVLQSVLTSSVPDLSKGILNKTLQYITDTTTRYAAPVPNATSDVTLIASAGIELLGNNARKSSGVSDWDEQVYSKESYTGGAYAQAKAQSSLMMFGLNPDPTTSPSFISIDYAMYVAASNELYAYEAGVQQGGVLGTWAVGDVLTVMYDGSNVRYLKNGTVLRTVTAAPDLVLFFDSSFYAGGEIKGIRFGPMSSNNAAAVGVGTFKAGMSIKDALDIARALENTRDAVVSNARDTGTIYSLLLEMMMREGFQYIPGERSSTMDLKDKAGLLTMWNATDGQIENAKYKDMTDNVAVDFHASRRASMSVGMYFGY